MDKKDLRNKILEIRDNIIDRSEKDKKILERLVNSDVFKNSKNIFIYVSYSSEVNTKEIINIALKLNKNIYVPKVIKSERKMNAVQINDIKNLKSGVWGILEPESDEGLKELDIIDLIIMPGVVFDEIGNRIGYGGGYYDKFLSNIKANGYKVAIAYKEQLADLINVVEEHDIKYDMLITDDIIVNRKK